MEYEATFGINCGATCMGGKLSESEKRVEQINVEQPELALRKALCLAMNFSYDYLSDPFTKKTKVKLVELKDKTGNVLPQETLLKSLVEILAKEANISKDKIDFSMLKLEDNCYFVETTSEEKLLDYLQNGL